MEFVGVVLLFMFFLVYEKVWRIKVCKRKIYRHVNQLNGKVNKIEKLTARDEIFSVYYTVEGLSRHSNVRFNFFYKDIWENSN
jgi:hypothetical protein